MFSVVVCMCSELVLTANACCVRVLPCGESIYGLYDEACLLLIFGSTSQIEPIAPKFAACT